MHRIIGSVSHYGHRADLSTSKECDPLLKAIEKEILWKKKPKH